MERPPAWREWASALNGLLFRFKAFDEHGTRVIDSLRASDSPEIDERYRQEKWLFAFFVEGLSAIECLDYGLYFLGALTDSKGFDAGIDPRAVTIDFVASRFAAVFPSDLATRLNEVASGDELKLWKDVRNVLAHRGAPPRHFVMGGATSWGLSEAASQLLDPDRLTERRERLGEAVTGIVEAALPFVQEHVT